MLCLMMFCPIADRNSNAGSIFRHNVLQPVHEALTAIVSAAF